MKWPKGKHNGRKIQGFNCSLALHVLWWVWKPAWNWNRGEPFFIWLCFTVRAKAEYLTDAQR